MREYKEHLDGRIVDLDDPYTYKHLPKTYNELEDKMYQEIGQALVYMDWLYSRKGLFPKTRSKRKKDKRFSTKKEWDLFINCGWRQRQRIYKLIKNFADNKQDHIGDIQWMQEQVFLFQDETENMC